MQEVYNKNPLTFEEQLDRLEKRGLKIQDRQRALSILSHISYYRLSGYWHPFRQRNSSGQTVDAFVTGASFEEVVKRYEFDRKLRLLILDAIERVEVSLRTRMTYHLAHTYGTFGHINPKNFHSKFNHQEWLEELENKEIYRSREEFIRHFKKKYIGFPRVPIWMATETMSLGLLSKLFNGLGNKDKHHIAEIYQLHPKTLTDWLHVLTYIRNLCAHHARLWNRNLAIRPNLDGLNDRQLNLKFPVKKNNNLFVVLSMLNFLLQTSGNGEDWRNNIETLLLTIKENSSMHRNMGLPTDWQKGGLWLV